MRRFVWELEAKAELISDHAFEVHQNWKAEPILAAGLAAVRGVLHRQRHKGCTAGFDFGVRRFERLKVKVAVWTPDATIEGDHQRPLGQPATRVEDYSVGV